MQFLADRQVESLARCVVCLSVVVVCLPSSVTHVAYIVAKPDVSGGRQWYRWIGIWRLPIGCQ